MKKILVLASFIFVFTSIGAETIFERAKRKLEEMKTINTKRLNMNFNKLKLLLVLFLSYTEIAHSTPPSDFQVPPWKSLIKYDAKNSFSREIFVNDSYKSKSDSISEVWQLVSFHGSQNINGGASYGSQLELWGYECNKKSQRLIYFKRFNFIY